MSVILQGLSNQADVQAMLNAKAAALTAGATINASRNLALGDVGQLFTVDTSAGAVVLTLNAGVLASVKDAIYFRRSGANALRIVAGTAAVNNPGNVNVANGDIVGLLCTAPDVGLVVGAPSIELLNALPAIDNTYEGTVIVGRNAGAALAQWNAVALGAAGTWLLADANGAAGTYPAHGLAVAAYADTVAATVLVDGVARNDAWAWTIGAPIYLSTAAGGLTQVAPAVSGDKVQILGYALSADSIRVCPSLEYLTVT